MAGNIALDVFASSAVSRWMLAGINRIASLNLEKTLEEKPIDQVD
jgi:hypothetical protein